MSDSVPSRNLMPLVTASTVTLAGAVVTIITFIIHQLTHQALPEEVEQAILVLVEAGFAFAAHRLTQP